MADDAAISFLLVIRCSVNLGPRNGAFSFRPKKKAPTQVMPRQTRTRLAESRFASRVAATRHRPSYDALGAAEAVTLVQAPLWPQGNPPDWPPSPPWAGREAKEDRVAKRVAKGTT